MDIPFELIFYNYFEEPFPIREFAASQELLLMNESKYSIDFKENHDLGLLFQTNHNCRLELELLDVLPGQCFTEEELQDNDRPYFLSNNRKRYIYLNSKSDKNELKLEYPMLIPGSYKITVKTPEQDYYAFLKIIPLRIDDQQLVNMKEEIDSYISGLSKEFKSSANIDLESISNNSLLHKTNLFIEQKSKIINALNSIITSPRYEIKRNYKLTEVSKSGRIDFKTIRFKQRRMDIHDKLLTFYNTVEYDIDENKIMKLIAKNLYREINLCLTFLTESINRNDIEVIEAQLYDRQGAGPLKSGEYLKINFRKLKLIANLLQRFLSSEWIKLIENISYVNKPRKLVRHVQYNVVYSLYLELNNQKEIKIDPLKNYNYFWKESSKLYEIWCFLKIMEIIELCKFEMEPRDGWIYSQYKHDQIFPFLDPGTRITFKNKDDLKFVLYYDSELLDMKNCSIENPVYTVKSHKRPDFRIDVYRKDIYYKTIIGDFKYRPYDRLENISQYRKSPMNNSSVYNQLLDYSEIRSSFVKSESEKQRSEAVAHETWVLYPTKMEEPNKNRRNWDRETNIRRMELSPNKDTIMLMSHLEQVVDEIIEM